MSLKSKHKKTARHIPLKVWVRAQSDQEAARKFFAGKRGAKRGGKGR